jgi:hypothetical protein
LRSSLMPLNYHPVCEDARIEVATNEPEHTAVRDPVGQSSYQHVVVYSIEGKYDRLPIPRISQNQW